MSENAIAISLLPPIFLLLVVLECSRLNSMCRAQRRQGVVADAAAPTTESEFNGTAK